MRPTTNAIDAIPAAATKSMAPRTRGDRHPVAAPACAALSNCAGAAVDVSASANRAAVANRSAGNF
jgi:hypothetical protein